MPSTLVSPTRLARPAMINSLDLNQSVYVAGHRGMVGRAVVRALKEHGFKRLITPSRDEVDLCEQNQVKEFYSANEPDIVIFAAAKVGGIHANDSYPAEFLFDNLMMAANSIEAAHRSQISRFLFLGSTCIYPRLAPQPLQEESLLSGLLEPTNEAYALAKISGLKLCQFYRKQYGDLFHSVMPTNLYGPGDNYHPENSHVLPALLRRFHEAVVSGHQTIAIWGTGKPRRDFLHVDDLASAVLHLLAVDDPPDWVNVGSGTDVTIMELAETIAEVVGYTGRIITDPTKPDGTPVKRTDISRIASIGWSPKIDLRSGLEMTYRSFLQEHEQGMLREA